MYSFNSFESLSFWDSNSRNFRVNSYFSVVRDFNSSFSFSFCSRMILVSWSKLVCNFFVNSNLTTSTFSFEEFSFFRNVKSFLICFNSLFSSSIFLSYSVCCDANFVLWRSSSRRRSFSFSSLWRFSKSALKQKMVIKLFIR